MEGSILAYFKNAVGRNVGNTSTKCETSHTQINSRKRKQIVQNSEVIEISSDEDDKKVMVNDDILSRNESGLHIKDENSNSVSSNCSTNAGTSLQDTFNSEMFELQTSSSHNTLFLEKDMHNELEGSVQDKPHYLQDFFLILNSVLQNQHDKSLFEGDDMNLIEKFASLSPSSQMLYIRLYQRKSAWLPIDKISYPQISKNIESVLNDLVVNHFLLDSRQAKLPFSLIDVLHLLSAPQVKELSKTYHVYKGTKAQNIKSLLSMCKQQKSLHLSSKSIQSMLLQKAINYLGKCFRVSPTSRKVFNRLLLVFDVTKGTCDDSEYSISGQMQKPFFGKHQQLSSILLAGMGKLIYPTYTVHDPTPIFQSRTELLEYETAYQFKLDILAACDNSQWQQALELCEKAADISTTIKEQSKAHALSLKLFLRTFTASSVYIQIKSLQVEVLQRLKKYKIAAELLQNLLDQNQFCLSRRGYWAERLALNLDQHLHDKEQALKVIENTLSDPLVRVGHKVALTERYHKLLDSAQIRKENSLGTFLQANEVNIVGRILPKRMQTGKARFMWQNSIDPDDVLLCSVEEYALSYYRSLNYEQGIHGEGGTFSCFFCLLLWDIIFLEGVPDVFRTKFQTHPLDLYTDHFYEYRQYEIDERLNNIALWKTSDFSVTEQITNIWNLHQNVCCSGMNWQRFQSLNQVLGLAESIGGTILSNILKIMAIDLRHTRSGLPDLVVWTPKTNSYKFVEVKGPGDRLQNNQKMWMHKLVSFGANVEVCYVSASASRKLRV